jgi:hypothetical protein
MRLHIRSTSLGSYRFAVARERPRDIFQLFIRDATAVVQDGVGSGVILDFRETSIQQLQSDAYQFCVTSFNQVVGLYTQILRALRARPSETTLEIVLV